MERKRIVGTSLVIVLLICLCACGAKESAPTWQEQYDLGIRYLEDGDYEEAIIAFTAAIEIDPKRAEAYVGRGDAYVLSGDSRGNLRAARADYEKAIELDETLASAYLGLADVYIRRDERDKALEILKQGQEKADKDKNIAEKIQQEIGNRREEACRAYSEFLGADQSIAFSLVDLNEDHIPELVAGPIDPYTFGLTLYEYTLYTFSDGKVAEIYHGWVDSWYQEIHLLNGNMLMTEGHGTGGYHSNHYFTWDGRQLSSINLYDGELSMADNNEERHPEFNYYWEYPDDKIARGYFKDGVQISQDEYTNTRERLEEVDEILTFYVNTPDEQLRVLGYSAKQFDSPVKTPGPSDTNLYPIDYIGMTVDSVAELWGDDYVVADYWYEGAAKPIYYADRRVLMTFYFLDLNYLDPNWRGTVYGDEKIVIVRLSPGTSGAIDEIAPGIPTNATYVQLSNLGYPGELFENFESEYGETAVYSLEYSSEITIEFFWFDYNDPRTTQAESIMIMN